jgi:hypothetical protein
MENVLKIIIPTVLCLDGLCYFWYSSKKKNKDVKEKTDAGKKLREYIETDVLCFAFVIRQSI